MIDADIMRLLTPLKLVEYIWARMVRDLVNSKLYMYSRTPTFSRWQHFHSYFQNPSGGVLTADYIKLNSPQIKKKSPKQSSTAKLVYIHSDSYMYYHCNTETVGNVRTGIRKTSWAMMNLSASHHFGTTGHFNVLYF